MDIGDRSLRRLDQECGVDVVTVAVKEVIVRIVEGSVGTQVTLLMRIREGSHTGLRHRLLGVKLCRLGVVVAVRNLNPLEQFSTKIPHHRARLVFRRAR